MENTYNVWNLPSGATVTEIDHDYDLHALVVEYDGRTAEIVPSGIDDMNNMIAELNAGECPLANGWEDGNGNVVADLLL